MEIHRTLKCFIVYTLVVWFFNLEVGGGLIPANSDLIFELTLEKLEKKFRSITLDQPRKCSKNAASRNRDKVTFDYEAFLPDGK